MTHETTGSAGTATGDQSTSDEVKERAAAAAGQAQEKAREVIEDQVDQRSDQAADKVESVADDVRAVSESLSERGQDSAARIVEQGAEYAQQLSDYLRNSNSDQILDDVAAFARQKPWVVAAGGLMLGFAASRVLRASAQSSTTVGRSATYPSGNGSERYGQRSYAAPSTGQIPAPVTSRPDLLEPPARDPYASTTGDPFSTGAERMAPEASSVDGR